MEINLLYGRDGYRLDLPSDLRAVLIEKNAMPVLGDVSRALADALDRPVNAPDLAATRGKTACILVCDITRPVPNQLFLRPLIERLMGAGVAAHNIMVLVATGLHRPQRERRARRSDR